MRKTLYYLLCYWLFMMNNVFAVPVDQTEETVLKQEIGQMLIVGFIGTELNPNDAIVQDILNQRIGGVILYSYNIVSPEQLKKLTQQLKDYAKQAAINHHNSTPLIISIDYEGGKVVRLLASQGFPLTKSAAEIGKESLDQVTLDANQMAQTIQDNGVNTVFAPVVDVNVNPDNPIIGKRDRSFSSDPIQVIRDASIFSTAYYNHGILCSYKHFPGHGSSQNDSHTDLVDVSDTWQPYELTPYAELFKQPNHCSLVMTAHVINRKLDSTGVPATLSKAILTDTLRKELNFDGVVVTDDMFMKGFSNDTHPLIPNIIQTINAGADMLIFSLGQPASEQYKEYTPEKLIDIIYQSVSKDRINEAYQRIVRAKQRVVWQ